MVDSVLKLFESTHSCSTSLLCTCAAPCALPLHAAHALPQEMLVRCEQMKSSLAFLDRFMAGVREIQQGPPTMVNLPRGTLLQMLDNAENQLASCRAWLESLPEQA